MARFVTPSPPIRIFTETSVGAENINAQSLTVKEILSRLDPERFSVLTQTHGPGDERLVRRPNTRLLHAKLHGNAIRLLSACLRFCPDIYFYPQPSPFNEIYLKLHKLLRLRSRIVVHVVGSATLNDGIRRDWVGGKSVYQAMRQADAVFGNSSAVADDVANVFGIKAGIIHNGVDRRYFYPPATRTTNRPVRVLYAGSFRSYKRPEDVVTQAARHPEAEFRMVGEGEQKEHCMRMAIGLGCKNLTFSPNMSPSQLGEEMRNADLFLFPSVVEGHPQVLAQAAATGLPCIARDTYRPDSVIHGKTGFLAPNELKIAEYLDALIANPELRQVLGAAAIEHVKQFDWEQIVPIWANVFESLLHNSGART